MLKKIIAVLSSVAILMSSTVAFAGSSYANSVAPDEQPYGTKYIKHSLLNFYSDNTLRADKQAAPDN